ncbi:hypothetical protein EGR_10831 [Echinococcus granulosus]|uniref:Uncharacterized protein n=1 Tax=Echinococcus granulosus TaxID=6210 RepID=W6TZX7_ECHGR|nr:hypothetical protein EGR_10831 [Echinococcus granulosus]EUB54308.1 hypothetical protein EGR_10831 [Echinococcus granulosus]
MNLVSSKSKCQTRAFGYLLLFAFARNSVHTSKTIARLYFDVFWCPNPDDASVGSADVDTPNRTFRQHLAMRCRESDSGVPDRAFKAQMFVEFMPA